jgi:hypothetical protein
VCLVCYKHVSEHAGLCPTCEVDLLSLEDPAVRADLRAEAERRLQKKMYGEYFGLSLLGFACAVPTLPFVGELLYFVVAIGAGWGLTRLWTAARPRSALALYAERRRRLGAELAGRAPQKALPAPGEGSADTMESDPEGLDIAATLRWLGMDEPRR